MQRKGWLAVLLSLSLLAGCQRPTQSAPTVTAQPAATATVRPPTSTATLPPTSTATVMFTPQPSATHPPTPTATRTPSEWLTVNCLPVTAPDAAPSIPSEGSIVLHALRGTEAWLRDMQTGITLTLLSPHHSGFDFAVSPNHHRLAYSEWLIDPHTGQITDENLVVATRDGRVQARIPWDDDWIVLTDWLDDERLVVNVVGATADLGRPSPVVVSTTLTIVSADTGGQQRLPLSLPDIRSFEPWLWWDNWALTVYAPSLNQVVYLRERAEDSFTDYVLWDRDRNEAVAVLSSIHYWRTPRWSPDGRTAVIGTNQADPSGTRFYQYELYVMDGETGAVKQLTHLDQDYSRAFIESYRWSPDGSSIAFWLSTDFADIFDSGEQRLAVVNVASGKVTDYCVPGYYNTGLTPAHVPPPIWSPDGQQLLVENRYADDQSRVILVDLARGMAMELAGAQNMSPAGWLAP